MKVCCVLLLESPHRGDSIEYTQCTIFNIIKILNHPKSAAMGMGGERVLQNISLDLPDLFKDMLTGTREGEGWIPRALGAV